MGSRISFVVVLAALALFSAPAVAPAAAPESAPAKSAEQMGVLHFSFRDSVTGKTIKPDAVLVDDKVVFNTIDEAGRMSVPVPPGDHRVAFKAKGYNDLDSRQTAALDFAPMNLIMLDPSTPPAELQPENLSNGMPADGTVIVGYVTDDTTGAPVAGAEVTLIDKDVKVQTDENGFFKIPISIPDGQQMPEDPRGGMFASRNFKISKPGYGFEERLNVLVESGTPRIYQVTLIRGGGGNSIDESEGRNNLQSSLFGLSNVEPEDIATTPTATQDRVSTETQAHDHSYSHSH